MAENFKIAILTVTQGKQAIEKLLHDLEKFASEHPVIVVANGCASATLKRLQNILPPAGKLVALPENRGGSGGFAAGMQYFLTNYPHCSGLWLLDDDAEITADTLNNLQKTAKFLDAQNVPWGACGSAIEMLEVPGCITECGAFVQRLSGRFGSPYRNCAVSQLPATPFETEYCAATSLLVSRRALEVVGTFEPRFFIHYDDVDWSFRCRKAGFKLWAVPQSRVLHPSRLSKPAGVVRYYDAANVLWFYRRHLLGYLAGPLLGVVIRGAYFYWHGFKKTARLYFMGLRDGFTSRQRRNPLELNCESYRPLPLFPSLKRCCWVCSEESRRICCNLFPQSKIILFRPEKLPRLLQNLVAIWGAWRYQQLVIDDDFRSRFLLPPLMRNRVYVNFRNRSCWGNWGD